MQSFYSTCLNEVGCSEHQLNLSNIGDQWGMKVLDRQTAWNAMISARMCSINQLFLIRAVQSSQGWYHRPVMKLVPNSAGSFKLSELDWSKSRLSLSVASDRVPDLSRHHRSFHHPDLHTLARYRTRYFLQWHWLLAVDISTEVCKHPIWTKFIG